MILIITTITHEFKVMVENYSLNEIIRKEIRLGLSTNKGLSYQ